MIHGVWAAYGTAALIIAGRAVRDWRNPDENRTTVLITAAIFAAIFIVAAVVIAVLT